MWPARRAWRGWADQVNPGISWAVGSGGKRKHKKESIRRRWTNNSVGGRRVSRRRREDHTRTAATDYEAAKNKQSRSINEDHRPRGVVMVAVGSPAPFQISQLSLDSCVTCQSEDRRGQPAAREDHKDAVRRLWRRTFVVWLSPRAPAVGVPPPPPEMECGARIGERSAEAAGTGINLQK